MLWGEGCWLAAAAGVEAVPVNKWPPAVAAWPPGPASLTTCSHPTDLVKTSSQVLITTFVWTKKDEIQDGSIVIRLWGSPICDALKLIRVSLTVCSTDYITGRRPAAAGWLSVPGSQGEFRPQLAGHHPASAYRSHRLPQSAATPGPGSTRQQAAGRVWRTFCFRQDKMLYL